jgi:hypothetical protein
MNNINLSLFDSNYTVRAKANVSLSQSQRKELKDFFRKAEGNLSWESSNRMILEGLGKKPVVLTITEIE